MDVVDSWTNPRAMLLPETFRPCMAVLAHYSAAIKEDPSFLLSRMDAYASAADLESETRHVMWCLSCNWLLLSSPSKWTGLLVCLQISQ